MKNEGKKVIFGFHDVCIEILEKYGLETDCGDSIWDYDAAFDLDIVSEDDELV